MQFEELSARAYFQPGQALFRRLSRRVSRPALLALGSAVSALQRALRLATLIHRANAFSFEPVETGFEISRAQPGRKTPGLVTLRESRLKAA